MRENWEEWDTLYLTSIFFVCPRCGTIFVCPGILPSFSLAMTPMTFRRLMHICTSDFFRWGLFFSLPRFSLRKIIKARTALPCWESYVRALTTKKVELTWTIMYSNWKWEKVDLLIDGGVSFRFFFFFFLPFFLLETKKEEEKEKIQNVNR